MDISRIRTLAGVQYTPRDIEYQQLNEVVEIEANVTLEQLQARLDACKRALGIANTLPDPADRKKWVSSVFVNLNKIRAALKRLIANM